MSAPRFALGQGFQPDARCADIAALVDTLLDRLADAGHVGASIKLRDCNVARDAQHASGPCLSVGIVGADGAMLEHGFAYLFLPPVADQHDLVARALAPTGYVRVRRTATVFTLSDHRRAA
ncbi:hypothetical protein [Caulobacter sp. BK020]|uniref:hypothetical protein n=1 Tax=Caulobacter sp. BK020 TaxID=2512117 RepID=UPI0010540372|nr:hypothetical protein [Caulobacter sp. BK020]TCS14570.1 hypothetical protein EV278_107219 [Caulobacter sp. BK020]